jgi:hypothetical protein
MFLNWYHNFWRLMEDIGSERTEFFAPREDIAHLFPGKTPIPERRRTLSRLGSLESSGENLLSGVIPAPDLFLWFYSLTDLIGQSFDPARYLDKASVHGFLRSRWYATEPSIAFHEHILAKAFAMPTYLSSAVAYRSYLEYGLAAPDPLLWVLKGNTYEKLFKGFRDALERAKRPCRFSLGRLVTRLEYDGKQQRISGLSSAPWDIFYTPPGAGIDEDEYAPRRPPLESRWTSDAFDYVILAVPPAALADLVGEKLRKHVPGLASVRKLQSGVTAALDLYLTKKLENIPQEHVVLRGSEYGLTLVDNSQTWERDGNMRFKGSPITCLNVAVTDFSKLDGMRRTEAIRAIIADLKRFIPFQDRDIDVSKTYLQRNVHEPLFLNEVGSEPWRPGTRTEIPNLFLAGDFCDHPIGVVTVEGAVVSGLQAARAVQARVRADWDVPVGDELMEPIEILEPETYPRVNAQALKLILAPYAFAAKAWSRAEEVALHPDRAVAVRDMKAAGMDVLSMPGALAGDWWNFAVDALEWMAELPHSDGED